MTKRRPTTPISEQLKELRSYGVNVTTSTARDQYQPSRRYRYTRVHTVSLVIITTATATALWNNSQLVLIRVTPPNIATPNWMLSVKEVIR